MFSPDERAIYVCPVTAVTLDPLATKRTLGSAFDEAARKKDTPVLLTLGRKVFGEHSDSTLLSALSSFSSWLRAEREEGKALADFVVLFGWPGSRPFSYSDYVRLTLGRRKAVARLASVIRSAADRLPPPEHYELECEDPKEAERLWLTALLRSRLR